MVQNRFGNEFRTPWILLFGVCTLLLVQLTTYGLSAQLLPAPSLFSPSNGATGVSTTPFFDWSSVSGANRYWLTVATSSSALPTDPDAISCPGCVISCTTTSSSHTAGSSCTFGRTEVLSAGTTYHWRVQAWNTDGTQGNYSDIWRLTTEKLSPPDIRISPTSLTFDSTGLSASAITSEKASALPVSPFPTASATGSWDLDNRYFVPPAEDEGTFPAVHVDEAKVSFKEDRAFDDLHGMEVSREGLRLSEAASRGTATTSPILAPADFSSLGLKWQSPGASGLGLAVRYSGNGSDWSELITVSIDEHLTDRSSGIFFSNLIHVGPETRFVQCQIHLEGGSQRSPTVVESLEIIFIDPGPTPESVLDALQTAQQPVVVSRTDWGCPDGQSSPLWSFDYTTVTHLIVHHTETSNSAIDWPAQVRSIWTYHTYTKEWGDIGYNFLIDPNGVIYEGRAGGDNVIGAHFSCRNANTQGIGLLGSYSSTTPTAASLQSLDALLARIASRENVDPLAVSFHPPTDLNLAHISGHRDGNPSPSPHLCNTTACPGDSLYGLLPMIRNDVSSLITGGSSQSFQILNDGENTLSITSMQLDNSGSWFDWSPMAPFDVAPGSSQQVTVTVDFTTAPTGTSTRRILVYSNDPDESPYPGGVDIVVVKADSPTCHALSVSHQGSGGDPLPSPVNSNGCPTGSYVAGTPITLTADPALGWIVGSWTGTNDDSSTSTINSVTMPAAPHVVSVEYVPEPADCALLLLAEENITSNVSYEACTEVQVGANVTVAATGDLHLAAGERISIGDGFAVHGHLSISSCGQALCQTAPEPLVAGCHSCVSSICAVDASCCSTGWSSSCVDKVEAVCGLTCP